MYAHASALALFVAVSLAAQGSDSQQSNKEAVLGRQMAAEILHHSTPIHNPAVDRYLARLGRQLSAQFPGSPPHFTFAVIADDPCPATHEPAVLPGGFIIVPAALFGAADDEAEFAAMLAHSMEHIIQRHGTWSGCPDQALIPFKARASVHNDELEADALAIPLLASAGFDPGALARYIARVQPPSSTALSPLPSRDERLRAMQPVIERFPLADSQVSTSEFIAVQREISAIVQRKRTLSARPGR
jgi:predicted Zn-dependent protease